MLKEHVVGSDWTLCSKFINHSTLDSQHIHKDLYDELIRNRNFTLTIDKIFI